MFYTNPSLLGTGNVFEDATVMGFEDGSGDYDSLQGTPEAFERTSVSINSDYSIQAIDSYEWTTTPKIQVENGYEYICKTMLGDSDYSRFVLKAPTDDVRGLRYIVNLEIGGDRIQVERAERGSSRVVVTDDRDITTITRDTRYYFGARFYDNGDIQTVIRDDNLDIIFESELYKDNLPTIPDGIGGFHSGNGSTDSVKYDDVKKINLLDIGLDPSGSITTSGTLVTSFENDLSNWSRNHDNVQTKQVSDVVDGDFVVYGIDSNTTKSIESYPGSGLDRHFKEGDRLRLWVKLGGSSNSMVRFEFGVTDNNERYHLDLIFKNDIARLFYGENGDKYNTDVATSEITWNTGLYAIDIFWHVDGSDTIGFEISNDQLNVIEQSSSNYTNSVVDNARGMKLQFSETSTSTWVDYMTVR